MNKIVTIILLNLLLSDPFDGLTLITSGGGQGSGQQGLTTLIDNDENIINTWSHDTRPASIAYLMPDSVLYVPCKWTGNAGGQGGGPAGGRYKKMNWNGEVIWDYYLSDDICSPHHDIAVLPNGNILSICSETKTQEEAQAIGFNINGSITLDMIIEIEPVGIDEANIVWEWHFWDHLIQDQNPNLPNYGIISDNPQLLDINVEDGGQGNQGINDWNHSNCISYNTILDQIVISARHMNEIYIIDHSTTSNEASSHIGGNSGMGGDFLYRWGNPKNYGRGNESNQILSAQHGVNWIPEGYPGVGNLILFNNFHTNNSSAALEFSPPVNENGLYTIDDSAPYGPESWSWIYQSDFFSDKQSGAFRLSNGNTLITSDLDSRLFEVDLNGVIQWEYEGNLNTARAIKYSIDYFSDFIQGDFNYDELVNVQDIIILVNHILSPAAVVLDGADLNNDGSINVIDVIQLVNIIIE